jgi:hypothetical protein
MPFVVLSDARSAAASLGQTGRGKAAEVQAHSGLALADRLQQPGHAHSIDNPTARGVGWWRPWPFTFWLCWLVAGRHLAPGRAGDVSDRHPLVALRKRSSADHLPDRARSAASRTHSRAACSAMSSLPKAWRPYVGLRRATRTFRVEQLRPAPATLPKGEWSPEWLWRARPA